MKGWWIVRHASFSRQKLCHLIDISPRSELSIRWFITCGFEWPLQALVSDSYHKAVIVILKRLIIAGITNRLWRRAENDKKIIFVCEKIAAGWLTVFACHAIVERHFSSTNKTDSIGSGHEVERAPRACVGLTVFQWNFHPQGLQRRRSSRLATTWPAILNGRAEPWIEVPEASRKFSFKVMDSLSAQQIFIHGQHGHSVHFRFPSFRCIECSPESVHQLFSFPKLCSLQ